MKKIIITKIAAVILAVATIIANVAIGSLQTMAAENETTQKVFTKDGEADLGDGEATIIIDGNAGQSLVGKTFHIYKLLNVQNSLTGESVRYSIYEAYKAALQNVVGDRIKKTATEVSEYEVIDYLQSLNHNKIEGTYAVQMEEGSYSDFRFFIEDIRNELLNLDMSPTGVVRVADVREDGSVRICGLEYGYYIIDEVSDHEGEYAASSLCIVSTANPDAAVKIKSDYPSVTKKIQEDDNREQVGNDGWNDIADFEIGQTIPFKFTSDVPNMNGYDTYYYAWHDVMDEAITFNRDSVKIAILENDKEYILPEHEYTVKEIPAGETFVIEINDLKKIVDSEFNHLDSLGHNTYDQKVVLTYEAVLNDKAAEDTGRPGFENDVRIEFSNDPDSDGKNRTGFTAWDTVVCFTYKLNGLKVNDRDQKLEGAKFRLFRDEACRDEVSLKMKENGYNVINTCSVEDRVPTDSGEIISDENGVFTIYGLDSGIYYLKEIEAPQGYRLIQEPIKLVITPVFSDDRDSYIKGSYNLALKELQFHADVRQFEDGKSKETKIPLETSVEDGAGNLTVINSVGAKLPITGSSATIIMLGAGSVFVLISGFIGKHKRQSR